MAKRLLAGYVSARVLISKLLLSWKLHRDKCKTLRGLKDIFLDYPTHPTEIEV